MNKLINIVWYLLGTVGLYEYGKLAYIQHSGMDMVLFTVLGSFSLMEIAIFVYKWFKR